VDFYALRTEYLKFNYIILIISLPFWWREFDFSSYLSQFNSVRPRTFTQIQGIQVAAHEPANLAKFSFFCIISTFFALFYSRNFRNLFFAKFSHYFGEVFTFPISQKFLHFSRANKIRNLETLFTAKANLHLTATVNI